MKNSSVNRLSKCLGLERKIVGVKIINYKDQFDKLEIDNLEKRITFCNMVKRANEGDLFKAKEENFFCEYGAYALGIIKPHNSIASGNSYDAAGLYESQTIARSITEEMCYLKHDAYGVVVGPLNLMEDCDIVIVISYAADIMRILQGYGYKFGMPKNIRTLGNQGMCSDLVAKPFYKNDLNVSLMCEGARKYSKCFKGELGVAMPINMFDSVVDGVIMTMNPVASNREKDEILKRLQSPMELGIKIIKDTDYGKYLKKYDSYIKEITN
ncbi:DUF169 domain-containing protein [Clostridium oceanicum]|uniref:DUF169 domain-containing protein n=1 Tax=Clostridium oceanicum TaxID=1543 RepID=A0ABP3UTQ8_9CLOT